MPSIWDDPTGTKYLTYYDSKTGTSRAATPEEGQAILAQRAAQHRAARNSFLKTAVYGTAGTLAGGYGLAALAGGAGAAAPVAGSALPSSTSGIGTTAGYGTLFGGSGAGAGTSAAVGGGAGFGGGAGAGAGAGLLGLTGRDLATLGSAGIGALTNVWGTHQANSAADRAAAEQAREFEEQQKFLAEQARLKREDDLAIEAEKKRQWEAEQAEKIRQWEAMQPWRDAGQANLTRMNSLMDMPSTQRLDLSTLRRG